MKREVKKGNIIKEFELICQQYTINASEDNLNSLLDLYQHMKPNWVEEFNKFNERLLKRKNIKSTMFNDFLKIQLPKGYSVNKLKAPKNEKQLQFTDIMQRGRIIHLSNKIAHQFDYIFESRLKEYMTRHGIIIETPEEFHEVKHLMRQRYNTITKKRVKDKAEGILSMQYGFSSEDFEIEGNLESLNLSELIKAYSDAMYIKDTEIENVNRLVHDYDRQDVSYGLRKDDEDNTLFIMDIQRFGQFAVHVKDQSLIAQIKKKYDMPLYRRETAMLVNHISSTAKEFIEESKTDDSMDEDRNIPRHIKEVQKQRARLREEIKYLDLTKGEKHELAVKGGLKRRDLEEIDKEEER